MTYQRNGDTRLPAGGFLFVLGISAFIVVLSGCSGGLDQRFTAETFDENTEPLTNAIIGTPSGVVTIGGAPDAGSGGE